MLIGLSAVLLVVSAARDGSAQCLSEKESQLSIDQNVVEKLADVRFNFSMESLKQVSIIDWNENIFFSPLSIHEAVTLVYFGARNYTETQLKKALLVPNEFSKSDVQRYYNFEKRAEFERQNKSSGNYEFKVANALWMSNQKKVRDCMAKVFGDEFKRADFKTNPEAIRVQINNWVSDATKGNIKDLLPANSIDQSTDAVLANAVYFKGLWSSQFLPENTRKDNFYHSFGNVTLTPFMRQKGTFSHLTSEELNADVLELPYKGDDVSMYIVLPNLPPGIPVDMDMLVRQLIYRITVDPEGVREFRDILDTGMPSREVKVSLPKFTIERNLPVKELLSAIGASPILEPDTSDLTGFVADGETGPHLGDAIHRAKIEVSEEGTTASAATALFSFRSSRPSEPAVFDANHPFLYFIYDRPARSILFTGIYRRPTTATATNYQ